MRSSISEKTVSGGVSPTAMRYAFVWHLRNAESTAAVKGLPVFMVVVHNRISAVAKHMVC
jgi:hypothetical protein